MQCTRDVVAEEEVAMGACGREGDRERQGQGCCLWLLLLPVQQKARASELPPP